MVIIHKKRVIEIAPHLLCGIHGSIEVKFPAPGIKRKYAGEHTPLNTGGDAKLGRKPFLICGNIHQLMYVTLCFAALFHKGFRQGLDLVSRTVSVFHTDIKVVPVYPCDTSGHYSYRLYDSFGHIHRRDDRKRYEQHHECDGDDHGTVYAVPVG